MSTPKMSIFDNTSPKILHKFPRVNPSVSPSKLSWLQNGFFPPPLSHFLLNLYFFLPRNTIKTPSTHSFQPKQACSPDTKRPSHTSFHHKHSQEKSSKASPLCCPLEWAIPLGCLRAKLLIVNISCPSLPLNSMRQSQHALLPHMEINTATRLPQ